MSFFEFPHTRTYDSDLGWLIHVVKKLTEEVGQKTINYADPIFWDITHQYPKYTVVVDPVSQIAYLSTQPVPQGIDITDTDYWQPVFDFATVFEYAISLREQLAIGYEETHNASTSYVVGQLLFVKNSNKDLLYQVANAISTGDPLVDDPLDPGYNIRKVTFEELLGNLLELDTTDKDSLVDAINENVDSINTVNLAVIDNTNKIARDHTILIIGDSYSVGNGAYVPTGKCWYELMKARENYTIYNYSTGGSGFALHQSGSIYIEDEIVNAAAGVPDPNLIGKVILYAGYNDYHLNAPLASIYSAVRDAIDLIRASFPKADIYALPFNDNYANAFTYTRMQYLATFVDACLSKGVFTYQFMPFMFAHREYLTFIDSGNGHPTVDGNEIEYRIISNMLKGDNTPPLYRKLYHVTPWSGVTVLDAITGFLDFQGYSFESEIRITMKAQALAADIYMIADLVDAAGNPCYFNIPKYTKYTVDYADFGIDLSAYGFTVTPNANGTLRGTQASAFTYGTAGSSLKFKGNILYYA